MKSKIMKCLALMLIVGFMAATGAIAGEETITGMVEDTGKGIVINAAGGAYAVDGADLSKLVGKNVKATGTVAEKDGAKTITVVSVEPAE